MSTDALARLRSLARHGQPVLRPSLSEQTLEDFELRWQTLLQRFDDDDPHFPCPRPGCRHRLVDLGMALGMADLPAEQAQSLEQLTWETCSLLVNGHSHSGRTSVLRSLVAQFLYVFPQGRMVVFDASVDDPVDWLGLVEGDGLWLAGGRLDDSLRQLIEQLETLVRSRSADQHVLVVLDRLDYLLTGTNDETSGRLQQLVSSGPRRGIVVAASADSRNPLPLPTRRAFSHEYTFDATEPWIAQSAHRGHVIRPFTAGSRPVRRLDDDGLALGNPSTRRIARERDSRPDQVTLALDAVTHRALAVDDSSSVVVAGSDRSHRRDVVSGVVRELLRAGRRVAWLGEADEFADGIDVFEALATSYSPMPGEPSLGVTGSLEDRYVGLLADGITHLVVSEASSLTRLVRARMDLSPTSMTEPADVATMLSSAVRRVHTLTAVVASYAAAPFDTTEYAKHLAIETAAWIYLEPRPEAAIPGSTVSLKKRLVAASPGRDYGASDAVVVLDGERHDACGVLGLEPEEDRL